MEHKIISVPHSGTRSLKKILKDRGIRFNPSKWENFPKPLDVQRTADEPYLHFHEDSGVIQGFDGFAHVPLRWPEDVIWSWIARKVQGRHNRCGLWLMDSMQEMIEWTQDRPNVVFYDMYKLPKRRPGLNQKCSLHKAKKSDLWQAYVEWARDYPVMEFYRRHLGG